MPLIITDLPSYLETRTQWEGFCLVWTKATSAGYGTTGKCTLSKHYGTARVHRMVYMYHNGPIPQGLVVMHSCDNPACVNIEHLSLGTQADNIKDKTSKGRQAKNETHGSVKLDWDKVGFIRRTVDIFTEALIADVFQVKPSTIHYVRNGRTWENKRKKKKGKRQGSEKFSKRCKKE